MTRNTVIQCLAMVLIYSLCYAVEPCPDTYSMLKKFEKQIDLEEQSRKVFLDSAEVAESILWLMDTQHVPGVSVLIVKEGDVWWQGQYGTANFEANRPVADSTLFMLASVSKPFTGTALMKLWEEGYFELDDDIDDFLPYEVDNPSCPDSTLSFRMLLCHTSSIQDNWTILDPLPAVGDPTIPLDEFTAGYLVPGGSYYAEQNFFNQVPGRAWHYSNVAVTLIAYLVEEISGMTFEEYCQNDVFLPIGMDESSWFIANLDTNNIAMLYDWIGEEFIPYGHMGRPWYPAGQLRTSAPQMAQFLIAFMEGGSVGSNRLLEEATIDSMLTLQYTNLIDWQGIIWNWEYKAGHYTWGHGGNSWGTRTVMSFCPEDDIGVIVLSNGESDFARDSIETLLYEFARSNAGTKFVETPPYLGDIELNVYPNPFNQRCKLSYLLHSAVKVQITVYDLTGRKIAIIEDGWKSAGFHSFTFNADGLSSGVYFTRLKSGDFMQTRKVLLLR